MVVVVVDLIFNQVQSQVLLVVQVERLQGVVDSQAQ